MNFEKICRLITEDVVPIAPDPISLTNDTLIKDYYAHDILETEYLYLQEIETVRLTVSIFFRGQRLQVPRQIVTVDVDLTNNTTWKDVKFDIMFRMFKKNGFKDAIAAKEAKVFSEKDDDYGRANIRLAAIIT